MRCKIVLRNRNKAKTKVLQKVNIDIRRKRE